MSKRHWNKREKELKSQYEERISELESQLEELQEKIKKCSFKTILRDSFLFGCIFDKDSNMYVSNIAFKGYVFLLGLIIYPFTFLFYLLGIIAEWIMEIKGEY